MPILNFVFWYKKQWCVSFSLAATRNTATIELYALSSYRLNWILWCPEFGPPTICLTELTTSTQNMKEALLHLWVFPSCFTAPKGVKLSVKTQFWCSPLIVYFCSTSYGWNHQHLCKALLDDLHDWPISVLIKDIIFAHPIALDTSSFFVVFIFCVCKWDISRASVGRYHACISLQSERSCRRWKIGKRSDS